jgi:hypothetical protein
MRAVASGKKTHIPPKTHGAESKQKQKSAETIFNFEVHFEDHIPKSYAKILFAVAVNLKTIFYSLFRVNNRP